VAILGRTLLVAALVLSPVSASAAMKYLALQGFEDGTEFTPFWWWDQASGGGITYSTTEMRTGGQSAAMDCSTTGQVFFTSFYDELTNGQTTVTGEGNIIIGCVSIKIPPGAVSSTGLTDLAGFDETSAGHGNGTGQALIRADGNAGVRIGGTCTSATHSMTLDDGEWHRYCIGYSSTTILGSVELWVDNDPSSVATESCSTGLFTPDPDGFKVTCFEAIGSPVTADRYVDDVVVTLNAGTQEQIRQYAEGVYLLDVESVYASSGVLLRGDCSAQTSLECVDGTYTEPGNGTDDNSAGTHAVRLDDNTDCVAYKVRQPAYISSVGLTEPVGAIVIEAVSVEETTNNQVEFIYNTDSARSISSLCSSSGDQVSGVFNTHNALRSHKWERLLASDGSSSIGAGMPDDLVVGLKKNVGSGKVRLETLYIQALAEVALVQAVTTRNEENGGRHNANSDNTTDDPASHLHPCSGGPSLRLPL